jgi:hypothetical protein
MPAAPAPIMQTSAFTWAPGCSLRPSWNNALSARLRQKLTTALS